MHIELIMLTFIAVCMLLFVKGGKKRQDLIQRSKVFMSVDSDKSASISTTGGGSNPESDIAAPLDSATKVSSILCYFQHIAVLICRFFFCCSF